MQTTHTQCMTSLEVQVGQTLKRLKNQDSLFIFVIRYGFLEMMPAFVERRVDFLEW